MKRGFTLLELLVASLLLGMIATVMTMLMNQSSISWRLGTAIVKNLDDVRDNVAEIRDEADAAFVWNDQVYRSVSPWSRRGSLRRRACDADGFEAADDDSAGAFRANILRGQSQIVSATVPWTSGNLVNDVGQSKKEGDFRNYMVNVMSGGPRNDVKDWQAIWSFPDDFD